MKSGRAPILFMVALLIVDSIFDIANAAKLQSGSDSDEERGDIRVGIGMGIESTEI